MRCLIIEDDAAAAHELERLLALARATIAGTTGKFAEAQALLARPDYDVAFLDVELIGGNAFDLVPQLRPGTRFVFTTAYDRFALRAFEVNALDYLLKPIQPARLAECLRRLAAAEPSRSAGNPFQPTDMVFLDGGQRARFAPVGEIALLSSDGNYSWATLAGGERLLIRRALDQWERLLPAEFFVRVHRQHLVNRRHVRGYERDRADHVEIAVAGVPERIPVSRRLWSDVRARLADGAG